MVTIILIGEAVRESKLKEVFFIIKLLALSETFNIIKYLPPLAACYSIISLWILTHKTVLRIELCSPKIHV